MRVCQSVSRHGHSEWFCTPAIHIVSYRLVDREAVSPSAARHGRGVAFPADAFEEGGGGFGGAVFGAGEGSFGGDEVAAEDFERMDCGSASARRRVGGVVLDGGRRGRRTFAFPR